MKRLFLLIGLLLGASAPASAQTAANCGVNYNPQIGVNCANIRAATYVAQINDLVPAASATDFFCIAGSATKNIHIRDIRISGTATTLVTTPISIRRITVTLNTGTASTKVTGPRALNSNNPTGGATVIGFDSTGGNPTVTGTVALMAINQMTFPISGTSAMPADRLEWQFGTAKDDYDQGLDILKGSTTTEYCLNLGAVSVAAGAIYGTVEWTED